MENVEGDTQTWPLRVPIRLLDDGISDGVIEIRPGITVLVGPNGSGKTRALRAIKAELKASNLVGGRGRKTHFLAAGRSSPFEAYRAAIDSPGTANSNDAAVGNMGYRNRWWDFESVTGGLLVLDARADLRLKVETRLQQLFDRSVRLSWSQNGLNLRISPMHGGSDYAANHEASGILQIVALLAAIHNDEIGALLIDEPEISLHPQHQAFLFEEMEQVAGDPTNPAHKVIVIATHSATFMPLRRISDLPSIAFFNSARLPPVQVCATADILKGAKLAAMVARMSTTHRMAMFAERVLLVEGPSDEIIATQLARRFNLRLMARNAQTLPVNGKDEFVEAAKLFRLMKKQVAVLADLDALSDSNRLVSVFSTLPDAAAVSDRLGRERLTDLDRELRDALERFMTKHSSAVDEAAKKYPDWSNNEAGGLSRRRVTLARLLTEPDSFGYAANGDAVSLSVRYQVLLGALSELGCFFLRKGAVENYYGMKEQSRSKPDKAAEEAASFDLREITDLQDVYADIIASISYIAPNQRIDEDKLLRPKLAAALASVLASADNDSTDDQLNMLARTTIGADAEVFKLSKNLDDKDGLRIFVEMASPLFQREIFPFEIDSASNVVAVVRAKLPGNTSN